MKAPTLCQVLQEFGNDDSCREYLEALRWPDRVTCPRCDSPKISRVYDRKQCSTVIHAAISSPFWRERCSKIPSSLCRLGLLPPT
jgi:hypothetical protein